MSPARGRRRRADRSAEGGFWRHSRATVYIYSVRLVHLADLHLGFRQYHRLTPIGMNQREADVAEAFRRAVDRVIALRPDIVVIAGDVFHTVRPMNPAIIHAFQQFSRLRAALPDAIMVMVAGNHDRPRSAETGCILRLFTPLGFHVADETAQRFSFPERGLSILAVPDLTGRAARARAGTGDQAQRARAARRSGGDAPRAHGARGSRGDGDPASPRSGRRGGATWRSATITCSARSRRTVTTRARSSTRARIRGANWWRSARPISRARVSSSTTWTRARRASTRSMRAVRW